MKININDYRSAHYDYILKEYESSGVENISFYATCTFVPLIALYCFCRENYPNDVRLTQAIDRLTEFYRYEEIIGEIKNGEVND